MVESDISSNTILQQGVPKWNILKGYKMIKMKAVEDFLQGGDKRMFIMKVIEGDRIKKKDKEEALLEICEREHNSCNDKCPVYKHVLVQEVKWSKSDLGAVWEDSACPYCKNGKGMLKALDTYIFKKLFGVYVN